MYNPSFALAIIGTIVYSIIFLVISYLTLIKYRAWFFIVVVIGSAIEVAAYTLRAYSAKNQSEIVSYPSVSLLCSHLRAPLLIPSPLPCSPPSSLQLATTSSSAVSSLPYFLHHGTEFSRSRVDASHPSLSPVMSSPFSFRAAAPASQVPTTGRVGWKRLVETSSSEV